MRSGDYAVVLAPVATCRIDRLENEHIRLVSAEDRDEVVNFIPVLRLAAIFRLI